MKLHILFGQRKQNYEGEYAPEALLVWDEYAVDESSEAYAAELAKTREKYGPEMSAMKVILVSVNQDAIVKLLNEDPVLPGKVVE